MGDVLSHLDQKNLQHICIYIMNLLSLPTLKSFRYFKETSLINLALVQSHVALKPIMSLSPIFNAKFIRDISRKHP